METLVSYVVVCFCDLLVLAAGLRLLARLLWSGNEVGRRRQRQRRQRRPTQQQQHVATLLVTAHPDDEAMFFVPTIDSLQRHLRDGDEKQEDIALLCLSVGGADGLGNIRRRELIDSAVGVLGFASNLVESVDDPRLQDGPKERWDPSAVAEKIARFVEEKLSRSNHLTIVTFDSYGVSGHPNHGACLEGVKEYLRVLSRKQQGLRRTVQAWELESVGLARKYSFLLDPLFVWIAGLLWDWCGRGSGAGAGEGESSSSSDHCETTERGSEARGSRRVGEKSVGSSGEREGGNTDDLFLHGSHLTTTFNTKPWLCHSAMVAHWSQFVWYRRLFVAFSRYTYVNSLRRVHLAEGDR